MNENIKYIDVLKHFRENIKYIPQSIYPFSPIFKINIDNKESIIKKTRAPISNAENLAKWLNYLKNNNIEIVTPQNLKVRNPMEINGEVWVCYPYIKGNTYSNNFQQTIKSGELLGKIHFYNENFNLVKFKFPKFSNESILEDKEAFELIAKKYGIKSNLKERVFSYLNSYESILNKLESDDLPYINGIWDYKANNLIFIKDNQPVLVDPDSAGNLPRVLDLALAVLLFNNEIETSKPELFSYDEWNYFKEGYFKYVNIQETEKISWRHSLIFMFLDEALWLICSDENGWNDKRQSIFLKNLIRFEENEWLFEL